MHTEVAWDSTIWDIPADTELAKKAMNTTICKTDENRLIELLLYTPSLALEWGYSPQTIPHFIKNYPELGQAIFVALNSDPIVSEYLFEDFSFLDITMYCLS